MRKKYILILVILLCLLFQNETLRGQSLIDNEISILFQKEHNHKIDYSKPLREATNEIDLLVSAGFLSYKKFISSQDKPSCIFSPSCSVYAVESVKKKGIFIGGLQAFDRLSRCHPLAKPSHYPFDKKSKRYYDPID